MMWRKLTSVPAVAVFVVLLWAVGTLPALGGGTLPTAQETSGKDISPEKKPPVAPSDTDTQKKPAPTPLAENGQNEGD